MQISNKLLFIFLSVFVFTVSNIGAESILDDPFIPNGEEITYTVKIGGKKYQLLQKTFSIEKDTKQIYEIKSYSIEEDSVIHIDRLSMKVIYSWLQKKGSDYLVETDAIVFKNEMSSTNNELNIYDFTGINHLLRGFDFTKKNTVIINAILNGELAMYIKKIKETSLQTKIGKLDCYVLELGFDGFWGGFLPKTFFWFSKDSSHYCIKFEGQTGPPGSPTIEIVIEKYEIIIPID